MLTSLRTAAILFGLCGLLSACGDRVEQGSPPQEVGASRVRALGAQQPTGSKLLRAKVNGLTDRYIVVFDD
jgi:hypothetical protein